MGQGGLDVPDRRLRFVEQGVVAPQGAEVGEGVDPAADAGVAAEGLANLGVALKALTAHGGGLPGELRGRRFVGQAAELRQEEGNPAEPGVERRVDGLLELRPAADRGDIDPALGDGSLVDDPALRPPLVLNGRDFHDVTEIVCGYTEKAPGWWWFHALGAAATVAGLAQIMILYLIITGVGVWGLNNQVGWAWDITNFVFWIGIGHAGTLISAILCIFKQNWRTAVNRSAEAMTIFAVMCAGIFPGVHVGRERRRTPRLVEGDRQRGNHGEVAA